MIQKIWDIVQSGFLILWILFYFPPFFLFIFSLNIIKRRRCKNKLNRTLKKEGIPEDLRDDIVVKYKAFQDMFKVRNMLRTNQMKKEAN